MSTEQQNGTNKEEVEDDVTKALMTMQAAASPDQSAISALEENAKSHTELEAKYHEEWNELKLKYLKEFGPLYETRAGILSKGSGIGTPTVPGFWLQAMQHHQVINGMVEMHDEQILKHLTDLRFKWLDERVQTGFELEFVFSVNPFFFNEKLTKIFEMEKDAEGDCILTKTVGTTIEWKESQNVTEKKITRKQKHKKTRQTRTIEDTVECDSFFNLFKSHVIPSSSELSQMQDGDLDELEMLVDAELEIGCLIRDKIIPRAFGWYNGTEHDSDMSESDLSQDDASSEEQ